MEARGRRCSPARSAVMQRLRRPARSLEVVRAAAAERKAVAWWAHDGAATRGEAVARRPYRWRSGGTTEVTGSGTRTHARRCQDGAFKA
jgi:hypothetical protein